MSNTSPASNGVNSYVEPLTPFDLLVPKVYISLLLAFRTSASFNAVSQRLQSSLDATTKKIPWISGRVCSEGDGDQQVAHGGIHYDLTASPPQIADRGSIDVSISSLAAHAMHSTTIPEDVWPLGTLRESDNSLVFGASVFRFKDDEGLGLCVCMHHSAVDASGFTEVLRVWAQETTALGSSRSQPAGNRLCRVSEALSSQVDEASTKETKVLFALLPEYSPIPPARPPTFPSFASQIFTIPTERLDIYKGCFVHHLKMPPSTNTVLCALLWTLITSIRSQHRENTPTPTSSRLIMAVNGRRRIGPNFSPPDNPYLGNLILYASAGRSFDLLERAADSPRELAEICNAISQSYGPAKINPQHIANVFELGRRSRDSITIFPGWDLFNHKDLSITSWDDLDLYQMEWGSELGQPEFVRFPSTAADGVCIVLPRRRGHSGCHSQNFIEVVVMLKEEHMEALKEDSLWQSLAGAL